MSWDQLAELNLLSKEIVEHNQQLYWADKKDRLESVFLQIQNIDL
jgi:hypothetical protein